MRRAELAWFELHWPREVAAERLTEALRLLAASGLSPIVLEAVGVRAAVVQRLAVPAPAASNLIEQLRTALPGLGVLRLDRRPSVRVDRAVEVRLSTARRTLNTNDPGAVCRALLTALAGIDAGESLTLQWQLCRSLLPAPVGDHASGQDGIWADVVRLVFGAPARLDAEARASLRAKRSLPGWRLVGRIGVHAASPARQRQLIRQVAVALRSAEAPGVHLGLRTAATNGIIEMRRPWRPALRLNIAELAALSSWPIGSTSILPVVRQTSRALPPTSSVASRGRVLGSGTFPGRERPVALTPSDSLRHLHVLGPTGVGKSTLLLNLICQDIAAGRAVVVIEPKGDLIADVLARVPRERASDVVLIDPTDREAVVGINPLAAGAGSAELVADQLLGVFHHLYAASWGPRTSEILYASLLSLAKTAGMSLAALPLLLSDASFRRRIVGGLDESMVLQPFWAGFDSWSQPERTAAIAPVLNKVRPLLVRPSLRAVLGQAKPRFEMGRVLRERKILLVDLAKGQMGPEAAALLGAIVIGQLWQTVQRRASIAPERRHPVFVFVDEFQDYLSLPTDLGDALAQARSLGVGMTLAHQHLGQLSPSMRAAVLANARSRLVFQLGGDDARAFAVADTVLDAEDFRSLGAFEAYAQLVGGDAVQPWLSLRTSAAPPIAANPDELRALSRRDYGVSPAQVDEQLRRLRDVRGADDLGPRRRSGGAA